MSLRKAIDAKCKECVYCPLQKGTWRQQVEACDVATCPLYASRPKSSVRVESDE